MIGISALVVHRNTATLLADCVTSLRSLADEVEGELEVLVADCASQPPELDAVRNIDGIELLELENVGYGAAVNRLAERARHPRLLISNADTIYHPGSLRSLAAALGPGVGATGPRLWLDRERTVLMPPADEVSLEAELLACAEARSGRAARLLTRRRMEEARRFWDAEEPLAQPMLSGASLMIERTRFSALGGFDERFFLYHEDADLCRRITASGLELLMVPEADVTHLFARTSSAESGVEAEFGRSRRQYLVKHGGRAATRLVTALRARAGSRPGLPITGRLPRSADGGADLGPLGLRPGDELLLGPHPNPWPVTSRRVGAEVPGSISSEVVESLAGPGASGSGSGSSAATVSLWRGARIIASYSLVPGDGARPAPRVGTADPEPIELTAEGHLHRLVVPGDAGEIAPLFELVFGHPVTPTELEWKYWSDGRTPLGNVVEREGSLITHYGAREFRAVADGESIAVRDVVDVMSHPGHRGRGAFREAAGIWLDGLRRSEAKFVMGFPGEEHRKLGEALLGYETVAPVNELTRELPRCPAIAEATMGPLPPEEADWVWSLVRPGIGIAIERDAAYLRWRYSERPGRSYLFVSLGAVGLGVLAPPDPSGTARLMELLADPAAGGAAARVVLACEAAALELGAARIQAWFPESSAQAALLSACGWDAGSAGHMVEAVPADHDFPLERLQRSLFYSLGDYDVH